MTFQERYPDLELLLHISDTPVGELISSTFEKRDVDLLYLFGARYLGPYIGQKKIVVIESDLEKIAALKYEEPHICRPNVDLVHMSGGVEEMARSLAKKYPVKSLAVIGNSELEEALLRYTTIELTNVSEHLYRHKLLHNLIPNYGKISGSFDVQKLRAKNVPAIICGAGPSLDPSQLIPFDDKAIIIGGGSTIAALRGQLHLALAFDPNEEEYLRLSACKGLDVPLIFGARLHPKVTELFSVRGYMRTGTGGEIDFWLEDYLKLTPHMSGLDFGPEALSVTTMAIALAVSMGCSPIILYGCDFAMQDGKEYADGIEVHSRGLGESMVVKGKTVTKTKWVLEAKAISDYAKRHSEVEWIDAREHGLAIEGIQKKSLDSLSLASQGDLRLFLQKQMRPIRVDVDPALYKLKKSLEVCKGFPPSFSRSLTTS